MNLFKITIIGTLISIIGFVVLWNSVRDEKKESLSNSSDMSNQLKQFLENDQLDDVDESEGKLTSDVFEEEPINSKVEAEEKPASNFNLAKVDSQAMNKIPELKKPSPSKPKPATALKSKPPITRKSDSIVVRKVKSEPRPVFVTKPKPQRTFPGTTSKRNILAKNSKIISSDIENEILHEEAEIAYEDAYKRSLFENPYDREFVLEDENAEHSNLAGALTKLDIDRAVRLNDRKKLEQWLNILSNSQYANEQKLLNDSYTSTKNYIKSAIRQLNASN